MELIPDGAGCRLVFTQTAGGGQAGFLEAGRTAAGWDACLDVLVARLDDTAAPGHTDMLSPIAHYLAKFGLDEGAAVPVDGGWRITFARDLVWKKPAETWQVLTGGAEITDVPPVRATAGIAPAGKIVEVDPPLVLAYEWLHDGAPAGTVRWEFHSDPKVGERVELTQTLPAHLALLRAPVLATWHHHMELFFAATMGDTACAWSGERVAELTKRYATNDSD